MSKLAIVTGANKGIGYEIVKALAKDTPFRIVLCARDVELGEAAKKKIAAAVPASKDRVFVEQLDIADGKSIKSFADRVGNKYGAVDVMIHNAGMYDETEKTLAVNYFGTFELQDAMEKYLQKASEPRAIFVSSTLGKYSFEESGDAVKKLYSEQCKTPQDVDKAVEAFRTARKTGYHMARQAGYNGWGTEFYGTSKLGVTTRVNIMAKKQVGTGKGKYSMMVSVCPGYCATDLNNHAGIRTAEKGGETPAWLASAPLAEFKGKVSGNFWMDKETLDYL